MSNEYDGFVNLQSLARRVARAIVHFMNVNCSLTVYPPTYAHLLSQKNAIALHWDRVVVHRLEESQPGIWIPVLSTH